ncbi:LbtU family siderophore porin [Legionella sp. km772]|uniref:LbtU family siderophore porin n=1 Tax=Legionella sp. km772 TaxID=2498111 RepID=UPI000F8E0F37|nr:LbtU family siderophore porin [Legionella sp. km772]RUR06320.1 LbtU family siderophore porin [Legionella sp. km772]
MIRLIFCTALIFLFNFTSYAKALNTESKQFSYEGHLFFNATNSAAQGERYLLNQQLSNVKLGSELMLNDWNKAKSLLIYNTVPTPINPQLYFDQLYNQFKIPGSNMYFDGGKKWINFGNYKTDLIYKPLTKALGQTNEAAAVLGFDAAFYSNVSLFTPYSKIASHSLPFYNLNIGTHKQYYDIGASYIYSLAESQLFQYNKGFGGFLEQRIHSKVPGFAAYANINYQKIGFYLTYVSAVRPFLMRELSFDGTGASPHAFSLQTTYTIMLKNRPVKLIGLYDYSYEALALRIPKQRIGWGFAAYPKQYLNLQFQYFKDYEYAKQDVASGLNKTIFGTSKILNTYALQLVVNF